MRLVKEPAVRHDWTALKLKQVQRWVNRRIWRKAPFSEYDASIKTNPTRERLGECYMTGTTNTSTPDYDAGVPTGSHVYRLTTLWKAGTKPE
jgi:hypothetical protein